MLNKPQLNIELLQKIKGDEKYLIYIENRKQFNHIKGVMQNYIKNKKQSYFFIDPNLSFTGSHCYCPKGTSYSSTSGKNDVGAYSDKPRITYTYENVLLGKNNKLIEIF